MSVHQVLALLRARFSMDFGVPWNRSVARSVALSTSLNGRAESVQPELTIDRANFCRLDQTRMLHGSRWQRAFELFQPKVQELIQVREHRTQIVILPDVGL